MYYVSVDRNREQIVRRKAFSDFVDAIEFTSTFYQPRIAECRVVLPFETEVVNGKFARSFAQLIRPEDLSENDPIELHGLAARHSVAFLYDGTYRFIIESDFGVSETDEFFLDDEID